MVLQLPQQNQSFLIIQAMGLAKALRLLMEVVGFLHLDLFVFAVNDDLEDHLRRRSLVFDPFNGRVVHRI